MNQGKYVFAQLTDFLPQRVFDRIVNKYDGNKRDCRIFEEYAFHLIDLARIASIMDKDFLLDIDGNVSLPFLRELRSLL